MYIYPARILFLFFLITGTLISISSYSWLAAWIGIELNLLTFIPLLSVNSLKFQQSSLKYFLTQAWASLLLFLTIGSFNYFVFYNSYILYGICISLTIKLGGAPFHFWVPIVCNGASWLNILVLLTWQKIAPLILLNTVIPYNFLILFFSRASAIFGGVMGVNQTNLRSLIAFSSINHLGWILILSSLNFINLATYFCVYALISTAFIIRCDLFNLFSLKQLINLTPPPIIKIIIFINLLSLGGLPPFLGFLPKWFSLIELISNNLYFISLVLVISSLLSLYYYLRVSIIIFLISSHSPKWRINFSNFPLPISFNSFFLMFSVLNFSLYPLFFLL